MVEDRALFAVGQLIQHRRFDYRGVVVDVDPSFQGTEEWYEQMATSQPPRDAPWYHVLVDGASHMTYVAERNLAPDPGLEPIRHPLLEVYFERLSEGRYLRRHAPN